MAGPGAESGWRRRGLWPDGRSCLLFPSVRRSVRCALPGKVIVQLLKLHGLTPPALLRKSHVLLCHVHAARWQVWPLDLAVLRPCSADLKAVPLPGTLKPLSHCSVQQSRKPCPERQTV